MSNNRNEYVTQEVNNQPQGGFLTSVDPTRGMEQFKTEVAAEIGLVNYNQMDKGWLASRQNGYVGGNMTKKMVALSEQLIAEQGAQVMNNVKAVVEVSPEVRQLNEIASQNFQGFVQALQTGNLQNLIGNQPAQQQQFIQ